MRVLVTAGGTREPIDDVRFIANTSTGLLGARLSEHLAAAGHDVLLLHGRDAVLPRVPVSRESFTTSADLAALLQAHVPGVDAVVQAAAVADYLPVPATGKLPSDDAELVLHLRRAPKLIDELRDAQPGAVLVGFKLTSGASEDERVTIARALLRRARLDLVVVNDAQAIGEEDHEALLVTADGIEARARGKDAVAAAIVSALASRAGTAGVATP